MSPVPLLAWWPNIEMCSPSVALLDTVNAAPPLITVPAAGPRSDTPWNLETVRVRS